MSGSAEVAEEDSDYSFVVLGQGSLSLEGHDGSGAHSIHSQHFSLTNGEPQENGSINGDAGGVMDSELPGTSSAGIHSKLEKLVKENLLLKETLNQSNLAMKNQFDTLALWHEEVVKTHESHKQKFQETQEQIFKLRNENMRLKKMIQQNLDKCYGSSSALENFELDEAKPSLDISSLDTVADESCKQVGFQNMHVEELKMKNVGLEMQLHDVMQQKVDLEKKLEKALEENDNLKREVGSKQTGVCIQCQGSKSGTSQKESSDEQGKEKSNEIISLDPDISIIGKLSKSVEAELVMSASKQELTDLKKQFEEQSEISLKNSEKLEKLLVLYDKILAEKNTLKDKLEESKINTEELIGKIESLTEELKVKDDLLKSKVDEFEQVKKEMQTLVLDCEEVAILRAQVELYQNDFNEERKAREQAVGEKERIAEQVRFLERSLNDYKRRDRENERQDSASGSSEETQSGFSYMCPRCMKKLPTLTECESHVDACLNLDMFP